MRKFIYQVSIFLTFAIFLFTTYSTCFGQSKESQIDSLMLQLYDRGQFNGSILVAEHGELLYKKGFGKASIKESVDYTPGTQSYLASLTKQFTAMAIMFLEENNKLSYDDKLSKYFPGFPPYADKITIRNLLNHASGIPDYFSLGIVHPDLKNEEVLKALIKVDSLHFQPGNKFEYSNSGYVLLAMIVEKISGLPFQKFLKKNIFDPLGMNNTLVYDTSKPDMKIRAHGYNLFWGDYDDDILTMGDGGIFSTVEDLFKWDKALYTEKLVKQSTLSEAFKPAALNDGSISNYGFGWGILEDNSKKLVLHAGEFNGFNTFILRQLEDRYTIIFLTNIGGTKRSLIYRAIYHILEGKPYTLPKLSVAKEMYKLLNVSGTGTELQFYDSLKNINDTTYDFSESEINLLGYKLLEENKISDAIEVFKRNTEAFPTSSNTYESLGEAYMKRGDNELAITSFKKALEIDPKNSDAIQMMKQIVR
jgi:CubicO group peptidase (beta-lactamase class C family)